MARTTLVLIRHGHTDANGGTEPMRMSGSTDTALSSRGRTEVRLLRDELSSSAPFGAIYTSPLQRARDTARLLEDAGMGALVVEPNLREIDCGLVDGWPVERVQREYPAAWSANGRQDDDDFRWPGGESYREFRARCIAAMQRIARELDGGRGAVVTHAGVIAQILGWIAGMPPARWEPFRPPNASITEVRWMPNGPQVIRFADCAHLVQLK